MMMLVIHAWKMLKPAAFFSSVFLVIGMLEFKVEELI
jgi:hypothetical protein